MFFFIFIRECANTLLGLRERKVKSINVRVLWVVMGMFLRPHLGGNGIVESKWIFIGENSDNEQIKDYQWLRVQ